MLDNAKHIKAISAAQIYGLHGSSGNGWLGMLLAELSRIRVQAQSKSRPV